MGKNGEALKELLREEANAAGLDAFGVAPISPPLRWEYYNRWIAEGRHGTMAWMERNNDRRLEPGKVLPEARSILCLGLNYYQRAPERQGRIVTYALGADYHKVLLQKLKGLCRVLRDHGHDNKPYVDTGPVLERPLAAAAGLGWQAKNTMLIQENYGNWLFLGEIFTTADLPPDAPVPDRCGTCTRCLEACPTDAITAPYQLDASRCLAYLTIEHEGSFPPEFREPLGDRLFGCEECLEVCPWNQWAKVTREARFAPRDYPNAHDILRLDEASFRETFRGSPIRRTGRRNLQRNACVVLGNIGTAEDLPALAQTVNGDDEMLAEHAHWAIERIGTRA